MLSGRIERKNYRRYFLMKFRVLQFANWLGRSFLFYRFSRKGKKKLKTKIKVSVMFSYDVRINVGAWFIGRESFMKMLESCYKKDCLTLSWRRSLSYRNQSNDLQSISMGWFLYDRDLRHKRVQTGIQNIFNLFQTSLCGRMPESSNGSVILVSMSLLTTSVSLAFMELYLFLMKHLTWIFLHIICKYQIQTKR